ncbi:MAG: ribonuclease HI family protein [Planctomycetota bacterium]|nr:ribonuclease HI family protein [Planctomycetota bacterium]
MDGVITLNFDGGSRGNPGSAGIGVVLAAEDGTPLVTVGKYIGRATNNVAEYMALIVALREAKKLGAKKLLVRGDSELIIKQMRGEYRVKNPGLKDLYDQAQALLHEFQETRFEHNLRQHNSMADKLANLAMDRKSDVDEIPDDGRGPSSAVDAQRLSCAVCGSAIDVIEPSTKSDSGKFICPCGSPMS